MSPDRDLRRAAASYADLGMPDNGMITRRERAPGSIARKIILGALALAVVFSAVELDSIAANSHTSDVHHAVIASRDNKANVVVGTANRFRGSAFFASLLSLAALAALAAGMLDGDRRARTRRRRRQFSIRLRAPPSFHVAH
jgi:hypothetical protein